MPDLATAPRATEAPALQVWRIPVTLDGDVEVLAADRWAAQRAFEQMTLQQIAEHLELWSGEPELKTEGTTP